MILYREYSFLVLASDAEIVLRSQPKFSTTSKIVVA
jgi:hypothetical protein